MQSFAKTAIMVESLSHGRLQLARIRPAPVGMIGTWIDVATPPPDPERGRWLRALTERAAALLPRHRAGDAAAARPSV
jgi:hypothetical protein